MASTMPMRFPVRRVPPCCSKPLNHSSSSTPEHQRSTRLKACVRKSRSIDEGATPNTKHFSMPSIPKSRLSLIEALESSSATAAAVNKPPGYKLSLPAALSGLALKVPPPNTGAADPRTVPGTQAPTGGGVRHLEIKLVEGDIALSDTRLILLAQFQELPPPEAWHSLNHAMDGALAKLAARRAPVLARGELDVVPTGRYPILAESIAFLGLGSLKDFADDPDSLASAAEDGLRGLLMCRVEELATVLLASYSIETPNSTTGTEAAREENSVKFALRQMFSGFVKAIIAEPEGRLFHRITLVEKLPDRAARIKEILGKLIADTGIFQDMKVHFWDEKLPPLPVNEKILRRNVLIFYPAGSSTEKFPEERLGVVLRPAKQRASLPSNEDILFNEEILQKVYSLTRLVPEDSNSKGVNNMQDLTKISDLVSGLLAAPIRRELLESENAASRLEVQDDRITAAMPWECLRLDNNSPEKSSSYPALKTGLSRGFVLKSGSQVLRPRTALESLKTEDGKLRVLLVIDATADLPGTQKEGRALQASLLKAGISVLPLNGAEVTISGLQQILNREQPHILHYAGHSGYSPDQAASPNAGGLLMSDGNYFTGEQVLALDWTPRMVVLNSCESARILRRRGTSPPNEGKDLGDLYASRHLAAQGIISIAEAFLTAGVEHFIGTFWPVQDTAARVFGESLYEQITQKRSIGDAVRLARNRLFDIRQPDWANYIHYGDPEAIILGKLHAMGC
ncbi:MAG: CHAT domain-containing protein [Verrucomicrobiaceae bacterium]|nr:MAG: CHAT domain-containing protein [Verrucomicrobiaceae bacterium]